MSWIDAHTHLADSRWDGKREALVAQAQAEGIQAFILGSASPSDWDRQRELAKRDPGRFIPAYGLHPWWVAEHPDVEVADALIELPRRLGEARALGELGLDHGPRMPADSHSRQLLAFTEQLELARERGLPLVLHVVQAHGEAVKTLRKIGVSPARGIAHGFTGSLETANEYLRLGLLVSISGSVRRKGFDTLKRTVIGLELDEIALESDDEEPASIVETAREVARLRTEAGKPVTSAELLDASRENLKGIFRC